MPRVAKELGPLAVSKIKTPGQHPVGGVAGLMLQVGVAGNRSWVLRVTVGGKRREIGLGAYPGVGIALAREKAQAARDEIAKGIDPVAEREKARQLLIQQRADEKAQDWTFKRCAEAYIKAKEPGWRSPKHGQQWRSTLAAYVYPLIGDLQVRDVGLEHVREIVEPHWTTKTETISRVRNRIEMVLDWATVAKLRTGDNPARWKGNLDKLLAERSKVAPVVGHRALPAADLHGFLKRLREVEGMGARALEFVLLTACRSGEARGATWAEMDLEEKVWSIPGSRMKSGRPHRVPLSVQVVQLLRALPRVEGAEFVFPGAKRGSMLSDMSLTAVMRRMGVDAVPHGLRATFSTWCASSTATPFEVREMALAHTLGDQTVAAYQRSDLFEKRRKLMSDWARFIETEPVKGGKVVPLRGAA